MEAQRCPDCNSSTIVDGRVAAKGPQGVDSFSFLPRIARKWRAWIISLNPRNFRICLSCGHAWTRLDPREVRASFEASSGQLGSQYLNSLESGPFHDVPEVPEAFEAAQRVAELDALILRGRESEATRRYRNWTQTNWHEAVARIRDWHNLRRGQKLALFGWCKKDASPAAEAEAVGHPMRDRLLDG